MADRIDDEDREEDPRIVAVYRRMRLLVGVSVVIMGVGFAAVFGVMAFRLAGKAGPSARPDPAFRTLTLPAGGRVLSTAADGGRLFVTVEADGRTEVRILDPATLADLGRLELAPASASPPAR